MFTRRGPATGVDVITRCHRNLFSDSEEWTLATWRSWVVRRPGRVITVAARNGHSEFKK